MKKRRCSGPCNRRLPLTEQNWRPRKDSVDGFRKECRKCEVKKGGLRRDGITADHLKKDPGPQQLRKTVPKSKTYVITYAQNATPVFQPFLDSLLVYCKENNAELIVIPGRYTNPTSIWSKNMQTNEWWDPKLHGYLFDGRKTLGGHLTVFGDISIQPTAVHPLTGFEVYSGECSAIFGHPKLQLETVATAERYYPRILTTTGAVTKPNYTHSKAGKKAEAHHVYGACVVEQGDKLFHLRQINATKDGSFIELDKHYSGAGVQKAAPPLALICGDIHVERSDKAVLKATFSDPNSIVNTLKPKAIVYHDVLDFERRNHHTINDFQLRYERVRQIKGDKVEEEVLDAVYFLDHYTPDETQGIVVQSNHDEAYDRWLNEIDPRKDPINAKFFYESWVRKIHAFEKTKTWTPAFELTYREYGQARMRFLHRNEPMQIGGIYVNFHGDKGLNGSKGTAQTYAKLGAKTVIGHSHSPCILDGCYQVGVTGLLDQGYNNTPTSQLNTHCLIYANSKRTLLNVIFGEWRA